MKRKILRNIEFKRHAITLPALRQDTDKYVEGFTVGDAIYAGMGMLSWLQPGVTYTEHVLNDAGTILIPSMTVTTEGGRTALCVDGNTAETDGTYVTISVDGKVSAKFDGCFVAAGIADLNFARALNNMKIKQMNKEYQNDVKAELLSKATVATTAVNADPAVYLGLLKTEFFTTKNEWPTVAMVSTSFYDKLVATAGKSFVQTVAEEAYVNGNVGKINGLVIIPQNQAEDVILFTADALHIVEPTKVSQVPMNWGVQSPSSEAFSFSRGYITILETNAKAGTFNTYVHKYYGRLALSQFAMKTVATI